MNRVIITTLVLSAWFFAMASEPVDTTYRRVPRTIVAVGGAAVVNIAVTEGLKHSVHELRPDRSENNSFPSRHTSWAFTASTVLSNELYHYSPWWSIAAQAASSGVGIQRVTSRRHWGSDVVAGAVTGIVATELAYFVSRKIFDMPSPYTNSVTCDFRPSFGMSTEAILPIGDNGDRDIRTGFGMAMRFRLPLSEHWGLAATMSGASFPVKIDGQYCAPLSAVALQLGAAGHFTLPCDKLALVCHAEIGPRRWMGDSRVRNNKYSFCGDAGIGLEWHLTPNYGFRGQAAYGYSASSDAVQAITFSVSSLVLF